MLHAIVPVKSLALAKSRLSEMLDQGERRALALAMLEDVLRLLQATPVIARFGVVSRDTTVLRMAHRMGADRLIDHADDLNGALIQAATQYTQAGAQALLVLHADLPLATPEELGRISRLRLPAMVARMRLPVLRRIRYRFCLAGAAWNDMFVRHTSSGLRHIWFDQADWSVILIDPRI